MNNKKIIIGIIVSIILIIIICIIAKNREASNSKENVNTEISYNNETQMYEMEDSSGQVLHSAYSEDDLYIYQIDPNYDAKGSAFDTEEMYNY